MRLFFLEWFHHCNSVQVGLSCQGLNSAVPAFKVVTCAWTIDEVDIPLTGAKIAIKPCPLKITHKVIISLAIRHIGCQPSPGHYLMCIRGTKSKVITFLKAYVNLATTLNLKLFLPCRNHVVHYHAGTITMQLLHSVLTVC